MPPNAKDLEGAYGGWYGMWDYDGIKGPVSTPRSLNKGLVSWELLILLCGRPWKHLLWCLSLWGIFFLPLYKIPSCLSVCDYWHPVCLSVFCVSFICSCLCSMYTYVHMETRSEHGYLFSVIVHLIFEGRASHWTWNLLIAWLAVQWVPDIYLPLYLYSES